MNIIGLKGMTPETINFELERGAKFVIYTYCISILIMTFKRPSNIYFIKSKESRLSRGLGFSLVSLLLGWWGFPWGPIHTVGSFITNFGGGKDVTSEVLTALNSAAQPEPESVGAAPTQ